MLSKVLVADLKKIILRNFNLELSNGDAEDFGEFLVTYFGILMEIGND